MKIVLVSFSFPPRVGGIQVYLENLYAPLAAVHDVTVLAPAYPGDVAYDAARPFRVIRFPGYNPFPASSLVRRFSEWTKGADLVAFGAAAGELVYLNLLPRIRVPYIVHTHGAEVYAARLPGGGALLRRIARPARLVTAISDATRAVMERTLGPEVHIETLKSGVALDRFRPDIDGSPVRRRYSLDGRKVITCVSRLVARKGQNQIIRALPFILRDVPQAAVLLVGDGPYRARLERLARELGVAERVVFAGEVSGAELPAYYAAADVFAMPCYSRQVEGLGIVYLEAQACGRPAIVGDSGGAPEAIVPGETGEVVRGGDHHALARAIVPLLQDEQKAARMGTAGRAYVERVHAWPAIAARFRAMLEAAAG